MPSVAFSASLRQLERPPALHALQVEGFLLSAGFCLDAGQLHSTLSARPPSPAHPLQRQTGANSASQRLRNDGRGGALADTQ